VFLAREGHDNPVGINYLEKVQLPHLPSIYGAMLAGVGYVLMGAGVPLKIPGVLDRCANHEPATYLLQVTGAHDDANRTMVFTAREFVGRDLPPLTRPKFFAIIASNTLATTMLKKELKSWWTWSGSNRRPLPCHGKELHVCVRRHAPVNIST